MPITTLDPVTALVVIDLQKGILALPTVHPVEDVLARCVRLARAFREHQQPVVLVNVAGGAPGRTEQARRLGELPADWTELARELEEQPSDHLVTKKTWGAFTGTGLHDLLRTREVSQLVLCGVATSIGVESTARQGYELGFHITLAIDAMTDVNADAHANSLARIFPRLGETGTTEEILAALRGRAR